MGILRTRTAIHHGIIEIVYDPPRLIPYDPEFDGREEFAMDVKNVILAQRIIEFQFFGPAPFIEMDGYIDVLLF
jgi:hypothetical protein